MKAVGSASVSVPESSSKPATAAALSQLSNARTPMSRRNPARIDPQATMIGSVRGISTIPSPTQPSFTQLSPCPGAHPGDTMTTISDADDAPCEAGLRAFCF